MTMIDKIVSLWDSPLTAKFRDGLGTRILFFAGGLYVYFWGAGWDMPEWLSGVFWAAMYAGCVLTGRIGIDAILGMARGKIDGK